MSYKLSHFKRAVEDVYPPDGLTSSIKARLLGREKRRRNWTPIRIGTVTAILVILVLLLSIPHIDLIEGALFLEQQPSTQPGTVIHPFTPPVVLQNSEVKIIEEPFGDGEGAVRFRFVYMEGDEVGADALPGLWEYASYYIPETNTGIVGKKFGEEDMRLALLGEQGLITDFDYTMIEYFGSYGVGTGYKYAQEGKMLINLGTGETVGDTMYEEIEMLPGRDTKIFFAARAFEKEPVSDESGEGYLLTPAFADLYDGTLKKIGRYEEIYRAVDIGDMTVFVVQELGTDIDGRDYRIIDENGHLCTDKKFNAVEYGSGNYVPAWQKNGQWGTLNAQFEWAIAPEYAYVWNVEEDGSAWVLDNDGYTLRMDAQNQDITPWWRHIMNGITGPQSILAIVYQNKSVHYWLTWISLMVFIGRLGKAIKAKRVARMFLLEGAPYLTIAYLLFVASRGIPRTNVEPQSSSVGYVALMWIVCMLGSVVSTASLVASCKRMRIPGIAPLTVMLILLVPWGWNWLCGNIVVTDKYLLIALIGAALMGVVYGLGSKRVKEFANGCRQYDDEMEYLRGWVWLGWGLALIAIMNMMSMAYVRGVTIEGSEHASRIVSQSTYDQTWIDECETYRTKIRAHSANIASTTNTDDTPSDIAIGIEGADDRTYGQISAAYWMEDHMPGVMLTQDMFLRVETAATIEFGWRGFDSGVLFVEPKASEESWLTLPTAPEKPKEYEKDDEMKGRTMKLSSYTDFIYPNAPKEVPTKTTAYLMREQADLIIWRDAYEQPFYELVFE